MNTAGQILKKKGHDVWSVGPENSVAEALELMAQKNVGALVVMRDGVIRGIFSERDFARAMALREGVSKNTRVGSLMSEDVVFADDDTSVEECMRLMTNERIRHLPVMDGGRLAGIISIGDVVNAIIGELKFSVKQLENYITGSV